MLESFHHSNCRISTKKGTPLTAKAFLLVDSYPFPVHLLVLHLDRLILCYSYETAIVTLFNVYMSFQQGVQWYPFEEEVENILNVWDFFRPVKSLHKRSTTAERRGWLIRYSALLHSCKSQKCSREEDIERLVDIINETRCEICQRIRWFCSCEACGCQFIRKERDQHLTHWKSEAAMVRVISIIVTMLSKSLTKS